MPAIIVTLVLTYIIASILYAMGWDTGWIIQGSGVLLLIALVVAIFNSVKDSVS